MEKECSPETVRVQTTVLKAMKRDVAPGSEGNSFLEDFSKVQVWIEGKKTDSTKANYYRIAMKFAKEPTKALYVARFNYYCDLIRKFADAQLATEREKLAMMDWPEIVHCCRVFMEEANASEDRWMIQDATIMACFVLIPPRRIDYSPLVIVRRLGKEPEGNHLVVHKHSMSFVFTQFKNVETIGKQTTEVPKELDDQIRKWLAFNDTGYLFVNRSGEPMTENLLSVTLTRLFQKRINKKIGSSILRHSYVSWQRKGEMSILDKRKLASDMSHSVKMDELYRKI